MLGSCCSEKSNQSSKNQHSTTHNELKNSQGSLPTELPTIVSKRRYSTDTLPSLLHYYCSNSPGCEPLHTHICWEKSVGQLRGRGLRVAYPSPPGPLMHRWHFDRHPVCAHDVGHFPFSVFRRAPGYPK
ncbi:hypothetical protein N656DRAFT_99912 [Canariomyces notabilis]|uniref:Uncharacterized protein n=1 Tax=Canariomyces notabilis TaxID=2074819 RepID=A0AAN6TDV0_9PEZI|nr:hypothetical protein N656DRAFT_99912 [Canariomyces arenarius]